MKRLIKLLSILTIIAVVLSGLGVVASASQIVDSKPVYDHKNWDEDRHTEWHKTNFCFDQCNWDWVSEDYNHGYWGDEFHNQWHESHGAHGSCNWDYNSDKNHSHWDDSFHNNWHGQNTFTGRCGKTYTSQNSSYRSGSHHGYSSRTRTGGRGHGCR